MSKWRAFVEAHQLVANAAKVPGLATAPIASVVASISKTDTPSATDTADALNHSIYVAGRALKIQNQAKLSTIELEVTERKTIRMEEVTALIDHIGATYRGRILKLKGELASSCAGLSELAIEKIAGEKLAYALEAVALPADFALPKSSLA